MPKQPVSYLKSRFVTGSRPTQSDYVDVFDSYVHKDDVATINSEIVDDAINSYDTALRSRNVNGPIDSLGDVFYVLRGFTDAADLQALIAAAGGSGTLSWVNVTNKPGNVQLNWDEQIVSLDSYAPAPPANVVSVPSLAASSFGPSFMQQAGARFVVRDLFFSRVAYTPQSGFAPAYYADRIRAVVYGVSPRTLIQ